MPERTGTSSKQPRADATAIKGAGRCPRCASRSVRRAEITDAKWLEFYGADLEICINCKAIWERFDPSQLLDRDDPVSCFLEPCDNCAFRPGSPEQQDPERWRELMASLKAGASFNCHKGVPIDPHSKHGFLYPERDGVPIRSKLRSCRGWLNMIGRTWSKERAAEELADE